jgi:ATP/maltotriose-dependent transcriptional regulator MalT
MPSPFQRNLESTVATTHDARLWATAMCRLALHFARQGESEHALTHIGEVRNRFGKALDAEVAVWLMLSEGVLRFSKGDLAASADRLKRSYGIACALPGSSARPVCAAWLAHTALNTRRFGEMGVLLKDALSLATEDDHQARARACLVVADAFHYAGRFDLARPWYEKARVHATSEGDEASVSAMLHNVAAFRTANVRLADALGTKLPEEARRASMEATSAAAYDHAIGTRSFNEFLPHVNEQLLIVDGKYREALDQLSRIDVSGLPTRVHAVHYADYATCALETGDAALARRLSQAALNALKTLEMDPDDIAYVCCRLANVFAKTGDNERAIEMQSRGGVAMNAHRGIQAELLATLEAVTVSLQPT